MRDRPQSLEDADIRRALAEAWEIEAAAIRYAPLGGGSYHWRVDAADGSTWFASATDLEHAPWLGADRASSLRTLEATMNAAVSLRNDRGLAFVLAPTPCSGGEVVQLVRERYGLVVHPFVDGQCGDFGQVLSPADQSTAIHRLADLHATPTSAVDLHPLVDLSAHEWLDANDPGHRRILDRYDQLGEHFRDRPAVITHGEPHAGNLMSVGDSTYLIDWDTAALASPERDLYLLLDHGNTDVLRLYQDRTGHAADPAALAYYRLRWALEELIWAVRVGDATAIRSAVHGAEAAAGL